MGSSIVDWSALPQTMLRHIAGRLNDNTDFVRFRAVCHSWRCSTRMPPWLLLPLSDHTSTGTFHPVLDWGTHVQALPAAPGGYCCGSCLGWLVILDSSYNLCLLNPETADRAPLPRVEANLRRPCQFFNDRMDEGVISTLVLSSDPRLPGCTALAIFRSDLLAFASPGDKCWTILPSLGLLRYPGAVAHCKGQFYAIDHYLNLYVCSRGPPATVRSYLNAGPLTRRRIRSTQPRTIDLYVMESEGELLLAVKKRNIIDRTSDRVLDFELYRLDETSGQRRWMEMDSLAGAVLFLGKGNSVSLPKNSLPKDFRPNSIFFSDLWEPLMEYTTDFSQAFPIAYGLFNYAEGTTQVVEICRLRGPPRSATWITPSFASNREG